MKTESLPCLCIGMSATDRPARAGIWSGRCVARTIRPGNRAGKGATGSFIRRPSGFIGLLGYTADPPTATPSDFAMYPVTEPKPNAFNIARERTLVLQAADPALADICEYRPAGSAEPLTHCWRSLSGVRFVRLDGFDFPAATPTDIQNGYRAGLKREMAADIYAGAILLVGRRYEALGALKVVLTDDDAVSGCYIFIFKKLPLRR